jgi:Holliday junction resolvase RusA-like endonuclease
MTEIILENAPMPPTSNHQYIPMNGRLIMGPELRTYKNQEFPYWAMKYRPIINTAKALIAEWLAQGKVFDVEMTVYFEHEKLFTKKNLPKKLDGSNRLKSFHDCLADVLGVDDSYFFNIHVKKLPSSKPRIDVRITPMESPHGRA